jgi:putative heme transporter
VTGDREAERADAGQAEPASAAAATSRRRWRSIAQAIVVTAIVGGVGAAIYADRTTFAAGAAALGDVRLRWVGYAIGAEAVSMVAFAQLEKGLLRAGGLTGRALTLRAVLATAYRANAIAIMVPVAGSGMATAYAYREFRRRGVDPAQVAVALTVAGICSTVTFALLAAVAALLTGNVAAAALAGAGGMAGTAAAGAALLSFRYSWARAWLEAVTVFVLRACRRVIRRPASDPAELVAGAVARVRAVRLGYRAGWQALGWALVNWVADAACLVCAIVAARAQVPWRDVLIVWTAGASAASFCPLPAGLGVVDIVLITALAAAGLTATKAVAAVLVYRIITFKILFTLAWMAYERLASHPRRVAEPGR